MISIKGANRAAVDHRLRQAASDDSDGSRCMRWFCRNGREWFFQSGGELMQQRHQIEHLEGAMYLAGEEEIEAIARVIRSGQLFRYRADSECERFEK